MQRATELTKRKHGIALRITIHDPRSIIHLEIQILVEENMRLMSSDCGEEREEWWCVVLVVAVLGVVHRQRPSTEEEEVCVLLSCAQHALMDQRTTDQTPTRSTYIDSTG